MLIGYANSGEAHTSTHTSTHTSLESLMFALPENVKRLIKTIGAEEKSVQEMMADVGLKNRPNFLEYSLAPAIKEGLVKLKYPESPRHPRQNYLLTAKGLAVYDKCAD